MRPSPLQKLVLAGVISTFCSLPAHASSYVVNTLADSGMGSLREAIANANIDPGFDAITFSPGLSGVLEVTGGALAIQGDLIIDGPGSGVLTLSGFDTNSIFEITSGSVEVSDLTLTHGYGQLGGAVYVAGIADVLMTRCVVSDSVAPSTGWGGAVFNNGASFTANDCTFSGNRANRGGAIYNRKSISLNNCTFLGNRAAGLNDANAESYLPGAGGAFYNLSNNVSPTPTVSLVNDTFQGNAVIGDPAYAAAFSADRGGGAINTSGTTRVSNCTLAQNTDSTGTAFGYQPVGTLFATGFKGTNNLFVVDSGPAFLGYTNPTASGDFNRNFAFDSFSSAGLSAPAANGGPVPTMALLISSPMVDIGRPAVSTTDARGLPRPFGGGVDVGAYELQSKLPTPLPTISIENASITEGNSGTRNAVFNVRLSAAQTKAVTVKYSTAPAPSNGATAGLDYVPVSAKSLTFAPGTVLQTISVAILGDSIDEVDEQFKIQLSAPTKATLKVDSALGTILDDDGAPVFSARASKVIEGSTLGTMDFVVTLSNPSSRTVKLKVSTGPGSVSPATAGADYIAIAGQTLSFAAGETSKTVSVTVKDDTLDEDDESLVLVLSEPSNATVGSASIGGTILDNDDMPAFSIDDVSVVEGNKNTTTATFTVTLNAPSGRETGVDFGTANGTAVAVGDFAGISGSLTFVPGQIKQKISVAVKGETTFEADEDFKLVLKKSRNATLAKATGIGTIINDDKAPPAKATAASAASA